MRSGELQSDKLFIELKWLEATDSLPSSPIQMPATTSIRLSHLWIFPVICLAIFSEIWGTNCNHRYLLRTQNKSWQPAWLEQADSDRNISGIACAIFAFFHSITIGLAAVMRASALICFPPIICSPKDRIPLLPVAKFQFASKQTQCNAIPLPPFSKTRHISLMFPNFLPD